MILRAGRTGRPHSQKQPAEALLVGSSVQHGRPDTRGLTVGSLDALNNGRQAYYAAGVRGNTLVVQRDHSRIGFARHSGGAGQRQPWTRGNQMANTGPPTSPSDEPKAASRELAEVTA